MRREYICGRELDVIRHYHHSFYNTKEFLKSVDERKRFVLFFLPGNPGSIEFYIYFLQILQIQLNANNDNSACVYDIHCTAQFGHHLKPRTNHHHEPDVAFDYDFQVKHQHMFINETLRGYKANAPLQVILLGHSIGDRIR